MMLRLGSMSRPGQAVTAIKIAAFLVVVLLGASWLSTMHEFTYVWQSTSLANVITRSTRSSCDFGANIDESKTLVAAHHQTRPPRIAVLGLFGGEWPGPVMERVLRNKEFYTKLHGYDLINGNVYIDRSRPVAWSKIIAVRALLQKYDYVMYIDMDAIIMNFSIPIEAFIAAGNFNDLIMTEDWSGANSGVWIAKNTSWMTGFLEEADRQRQLVPPTTKDGKKYPFEYEQRAFHFLLDTKKWRERDLPKYPADRVAENRRHVTFLPQCAMNSYSVHPMDRRGGRKQTQYVDGDFIIHFAGKKGAIKTNLLEHYLSISEDRLRSISKSHLDSRGPALVPTQRSQSKRALRTAI